MSAKTGIFVVCSLIASPAFAQFRIEVTAPAIHFEAPPPLVVVQPGVQVVEDYDEEVFFTDGWYWLHRDDRWYHTRDYRGGWAVVAPPYVPARLVRLPPGHYRHWKAEKRAFHE